MKKKNIYILIGIIIVAVLMYINWITMHYSADTYNIINVGYEKYATNWSLKDGRLFMYIITMISAKINKYTYYYIYNKNFNSYNY